MSVTTVIIKMHYQANSRLENKNQITVNARLIKHCNIFYGGLLYLTNS